MEPKNRDLAGDNRTALDFIATHRLFDTVPAIKEDYSDLLPNPPEDPTSWRAARSSASCGMLPLKVTQVPAIFPQELHRAKRRAS